MEYAKEEGNTPYIRPKNHFSDVLARIKSHIHSKSA